MKAKYIGRYKEPYSDAVHLFYEYRGYEYMITDEHNGYSETIREKHKYEQARIDDIIKHKSTQIKSSGSDRAIDILWQYWEE